MNQRNVTALAAFISIGIVAGCASASESLLVQQKSEPKLVIAKETVKEQKYDTLVSLREKLKVPEHWQSESSDQTGKISLSVDAEITVPPVNSIPIIPVSQHSFTQKEIDAVTQALFGDADVYDADTYTALEAPYVFQEELIDPWAPEQGSVKQFNSFVETADGSCYRYNLTKTDAFPMKVWAKKIDSVAALAEKHDAIWLEHAPMKQLYAWVPDESELSGEIGMTKTEAQRLADETVDRLNLTDMQVCSSELVLGLRLGYSGAPQKKDMINAGYAFHYTRNLHAVPITYTAVSGGAKMGMENDAVRWGYETLDIYITKDGIDEICFANQYDIGSPDTNKMELLPFSDIMAVFDKMMQVQNVALFIDKSADEGDYGTPPQAVNYHIDKITLGYMRIYDPYSGKREGKLVPVWDFYGSCTISYDGITPKSFRDANKSVLTVNAIDGTVVDRWLGF